jgi:hypothetical protein
MASRVFLPECCDDARQCPICRCARPRGGSPAQVAGTRRTTEGRTALARRSHGQEFGHLPVLRRRADGRRLGHPHRRSPARRIRQTPRRPGRRGDRDRAGRRARRAARAGPRPGGRFGDGPHQGEAARRGLDAHHGGHAPAAVRRARREERRGGVREGEVRSGGGVAVERVPGARSEGGVGAHGVLGACGAGRGRGRRRRRLGPGCRGHSTAAGRRPPCHRRAGCSPGRAAVTSDRRAARASGRFAAQRRAGRFRRGPLRPGRGSPGSRAKCRTRSRRTAWPRPSTP